MINIYHLRQEELRNLIFFWTGERPLPLSSEAAQYRSNPKDWQRIISGSSQIQWRTGAGQAPRMPGIRALRMYYACAMDRGMPW